MAAISAYRSSLRKAATAVSWSSARRGLGPGTQLGDDLVYRLRLMSRLFESRAVLADSLLGAERLTFGHTVIADRS